MESTKPQLITVQRITQQTLKTVHFALSWYFTFLTVQDHEALETDTIYKHCELECKQVYIPLFFHAKEEKSEISIEEIDNILLSLLGKEGEHWLRCRQTWGNNREAVTENDIETAKSNPEKLWKNVLSSTDRLAICQKFNSNYNRILSTLIKNHPISTLKIIGPALSGIFLIARANAWYYKAVVGKYAQTEVQKQLEKTWKIENYLIKHQILKYSNEVINIEETKLGEYTFQTYHKVDKSTQTGMYVFSFFSSFFGKINSYVAELYLYFPDETSRENRKKTTKIFMESEPMMIEGQYHVIYSVSNEV